MAYHNGNDQEMITEINVTPLVDIMLVLLIIFMLVSTVIQKQAIEVELPHAVTGGEVNNESLSIVISREGDYYVSGKLLAGHDELRKLLEKRHADNPDIQVIISADRRVSHGQVVQVIDTVRELEIYKFAIDTDKPGENI